MRCVAQRAKLMQLPSHSQWAPPKEFRHRARETLCRGSGSETRRDWFMKPVSVISYSFHSKGHNMHVLTDVSGYAAVCQALRDQITPTAVEDPEQSLSTQGKKVQLEGHVGRFETGGRPGAEAWMEHQKTSCAKLIYHGLLSFSLGLNCFDVLLAVEPCHPKGSSR